MQFSHYVMLALIRRMNGRRGRDFIIGVLRGSKRKRISYFLEKKDLGAFYNLFGFSSRADLIEMFGELLDEKLIEIREEMLGDGWYPLVYITSRGKRYLEQRREDFGPKLDELLMVNKRLTELRTYLLEKQLIKKESSAIERLRRQYPRAYEKWTDDEDTRLQNEHNKGLSLPQLSKTFRRKPGAIRSRLRKLGIVE